MLAGEAEAPAERQDDLSSDDQSAAFPGHSKWGHRKISKFRSSTRLPRTHDTLAGQGRRATRSLGGIPGVGTHRIRGFTFLRMSAHVVTGLDGLRFAHDQQACERKPDHPDPAGSSRHSSSRCEQRPRAGREVSCGCVSASHQPRIAGQPQVGPQSRPAQIQSRVTLQACAQSHCAHGVPCPRVRSAQIRSLRERGRPLQLMCARPSGRESILPIHPRARRLGSLCAVRRRGSAPRGTSEARSPRHERGSVAALPRAAHSAARPGRHDCRCVSMCACVRSGRGRGLRLSPAPSTTRVCARPLRCPHCVPILPFDAVLPRPRASHPALPAATADCACVWPLIKRLVCGM